MTSQPILAAVQSALETARSVSGGANADYIPFLKSIDSSLLGVAVVTADGDVYEAGDCGFEFALESISKVLTLALAVEKVGAENVRTKIGAAATGMPFNSVMALELHHDLPVSPLVNAGAMAAVSLVPASDAEDRWQQILDTQSAFAGRDVTMSVDLNQSEQSTNFHNRAIAWLLYGAGNMYSDPLEACDVYTRQCSTLVTAKDLAAMGATLANRGVNPLTGRRVVSAENVVHILAEMMMEGLYTASGDWAYEVGLPGKSGVGGGIFAVVPGQMGIAAFSPPLDDAGNSVRAQAAIAHIAERLQLNIFS